MRPKRAAFTLTELLVVMAVIGTLVAVSFGLFRGNDPTVALRSGQATLNSLLTGTRAQAALAGRPARLYFYADAPPALGTTLSNSEKRFLRGAFIAVKDPDAASGNNWIRVGQDTILPDGVAIVPWNFTTVTAYMAEDPSSASGAALEWKKMTSHTNNTLINAKTSVFDTATPQTAKIDSVDTPELLWIEYRPDGRLGGALARQVILSPAIWSATYNPPGPRFTNPQMQVGFNLSAYGVPVQVNDVYGF